MKIKTNQKALISLIIMLIGFIVTLFSKNNIAIMILQSGFEAGLVGGLADWFAVTALFRYPLGIPIPHTALLPNNRERITNTLVSIVENNLLNKSSIINKVNELNVVRKFLNICKENIYSDEVKSGITYIIKSSVSYIPVDKVSSYLYNLIQKYMEKLNTKEFVKLLINICLRYNYEEKILDSTIVKLEELVKREKIKNQMGDVVYNSIRKLQLNKLMQYTINTVINSIGKEKIGDLAQELVILMLRDIKKKDTSSRRTILELIRENVKDMSDNENLIQKIDEYKNKLTTNADLHNFIIQILSEIQNNILDYISENDFIEKNILPELEVLIVKASDNDQLIIKLENYIQEKVSYYIDNNHKKIGRLVRENIEKLDTNSLIELIEDKVGDDLQWIRINGAICGFFIGLVLGLIKIL